MVEKQIRIVYVRFKESGIEECFGSFTAIFNYHTSEDIGYALRSLQRFKIDENNAFENDKVVIKIFRLKSKKRE